MNPFRRFLFYRRVIVNMKDDRTGFEGVFWRQAGALIVLKDAYMLRRGEEPIPLDGEVIIERADVAFIQAP
jgi:small nuclear ribonucleoprotein (snRNP)-like protein